MTEAKKKASLNPVKRLAIGGGSRPRAVAPRTTKSQLKKQESPLPPNTTTLTLKKGNLGCFRMFIGHFEGTVKPNFEKARIIAKRELDIQTRIELIQSKTNLTQKRKEDLINQVKFGVRQNEIEVKELKSSREFWFEFQEKDFIDNQTNNNNESKGRSFLGKPKQEKDSNYTYNVIEMDPLKGGSCIVYPATFIEFYRSQQMLCLDQETTSQQLEAAFKKKSLQQMKRDEYLKILNKNINDEETQNHDIFDDFRDMFGRDKKGLNKKNELKIEEFENQKGNSVDKIFNELGDDFSKGKISQQDLEVPKLKQEKFEVDELGEIKSDYVGLSKRYKKTKSRATLENLPDFRYDNQDDEDEGNLNDFDVVDDEDDDLAIEDDTDSSEENADFKKIQELNKIDDIENKDYEVPYEGKENEKAEKDKDSDLEEDGEVYMNITDTDDDDDDDDANGGVSIKRTKKLKKAVGLKNNKRLREAGTSKGEPPKKKMRTNKNKGVNEDFSSFNVKPETVVSILRKHPNGIVLKNLWKKVVAVHRINDQTKNEIIAILKRVARQKQDDKNCFLLKNSQ